MPKARKPAKDAVSCNETLRSNCKLQLERAIAICHGQLQLAQKINAWIRKNVCVRPPKVAHTHIQYWLQTGFVPAEFVLAVESATGNEISRYVLRPDLYPQSRTSPSGEV